MTLPRTVADVLPRHVSVEIECIDRMYLNVYQPRLQHTGGAVEFFTKHRGFTYASSALMAQITEAFVADIHHFGSSRRCHGGRFRCRTRPTTADTAATRSAACKLCPVTGWTSRTPPGHPYHPPGARPGGPEMAHRHRYAITSLTSAMSPIPRTPPGSAPATHPEQWPACATSPSASCATPAGSTSPKPYATTPATPPVPSHGLASHDPKTDRPTPCRAPDGDLAKLTARR